MEMSSLSVKVCNLVLIVIDQCGFFFSVLHILWHRVLWHSHLLPSVWKWNFHYTCLKRSVVRGIRNPTFYMPDERSTNYVTAVVWKMGPKGKLQCISLSFIGETHRCIGMIPCFFFKHVSRQHLQLLIDSGNYFVALKSSFGYKWTHGFSGLASQGKKREEEYPGFRRHLALE